MNKKNGFVVPFREKIFYGFGMLGTNLTYGMISGYILIFLTDVFRISPVIIGVLLLVTRIWDAVNDPIMGVIADKTRTRWGKFRPYILISAFLIPVFTFMLFASPNLSDTGKIIYIFCAYIGWSMSYTVLDIPKWSVVSVMTGVKQERVNIISVAKVLGMLGTIGINVAVIPLVSAFGKGDQAVGYRMTSLVVAVAVGLSALLMFFSVKERTIPDENKPTVKQSLRSIVRNKPLLLLLSSMLVFTTIEMIGQALQIHYVKYNFGDETLVPLLTVIMIIPILIGAGTASLLTRKLGNKKVIILSFIVTALKGVAMFFVGYSNIPLLVGIWAPCNYFFGVFDVVALAMLTDTIDFAEQKTGIRNEGVIFSTQTFMVKMAGALGGFIGGLALSIAGYVENAQQSVYTLNWIHAFMTIIPSAAAVLGIIPILFYNTSGSEKLAESNREVPG